MKTFAFTVLLAASVLAGGVAQAETITLEADKTVMLNLADRPGTVVVGNPSIADVSINASTVFLHGRSYGNTNIIVLDLKGGQLANFDVSIKQAQTDAVSLITVRPTVNASSTLKVSYNCAPTCEQTLQIGDSADQVKNVSDAIKAKNEIATGSKTAEAEAPSAAQ
jgi:Flp pilus assembly secretin CpaC